MATLSMLKWGQTSGDGSVMYLRKKQIDKMIACSPKPSDRLRAAMDRRKLIK